MVRKLGYSMIALLVFMSSTFAIAPMAFCNMQTEVQASSCCEEPESESCEPDTHAECPICSYDLCDIDPTPAKPATVTPDTHFDFVTIPVVTLASSYTALTVAPVPSFIDSGPPIYLLDCVFRI